MYSVAALPVYYDLWKDWQGNFFCPQRTVHYVLFKP